MTSAPESTSSMAIFQTRILGLGKICQESGASLRHQVSWN